MIEPQRVELSVSVQPYTREIPLVLETTGATEESEININDLTLLQNTVELTGAKQILDALTEVVAQIDLDSITSSGEYEVTLLLPEGVTKLKDDAVLVEVVLPNTTTDTESVTTNPNAD